MLVVLGVSEADLAAEERWQSRLAAAVEAGFRAIELPADVSAERVSQAADRGLRVAVLRAAGGGNRSRLASPDAPARQRALAEVTADLERAVRWGASVLTVRPAESRLEGIAPGLGEYPETLQATHQGLRALAQPAARLGVAIGVEVAVDGFLLSPAEVRELLELVGSPLVGACLDPSAISRASRPMDWVQTLRHRIVCVRMGPDSAVDSAGLAAALGEVYYTGPVVIGGDPSVAAGWWGGL